MATIPSQATFVAGSKLTAAQLNTNVRDSVNFLITPPGVKVRNAASAQSIAASSYIPLIWDTEDLDNDGMHSTVANTDRLTAVTAGWYLVTANVEFAANATGGRWLRITDSGGVVLGGTGSTTASGTSPAPLSVTVLTFLAVGGWVRAEAFQNSAGALLTTGVAPSNGANNFGAVWVHS